jgi:PleD family two-component response regulator/EAL domain-containing protein (putative c-di-GMP-specific phosphodiesterase class I)
MRPHVATATPGEPMPNNRRARPTVPARQRRLPDASEEPGPERVETPPPHYWRRWTGDAPPADATDPTAFARTMPDSAHVPEATHVAAAAGEPPYRVLIVEDDRAQALFAEGVLNGAGIEALVASEPNDVLETMARFRPDLVLMDLHMPGLSGTELTALIRAHEAFLHTPIVFLTGDPDPEKQYEVLESGADDFLNKPIRPRHLVAAVQSRVKRARALGQQRLGDAGRHPLTGLMTRSHLLQRLGNALPSLQRGGVLFVEVEGAGSLRDRYGYAALEQLMTEAGRVLAGLVGGNPATRLNDNAFLVFAHDTGADRLEDLARGLRDGIARHAFQVEGETGGLKLRVAIGHAALRHGFTEAGTALEAAEQALRQARLSPIGLAAFAPPASEDAERSRELAVTLRAALAEDRFELAYQPIVAVAGGEEAQYQALLRLRDGDGRLHTAAHIVPAAEAAGLIQDIDRWVLESALDTLQRHRTEQQPLRLFVSQSPRTLARDGYGEWLAGAIAAQGIDGPSLVIDVPLADALIHSVTLRQFCEQMVPAGVQFCLSRFQHGEEADALMAQLPLGYVRLAARYADGTGDGALRDEMRQAIDLAHRQGLQVIGQQVEDPQAAATLWMSGIDYIQGNLVQQAGGALDFDFQHAVL